MKCTMEQNILSGRYPSKEIIYEDYVKNKLSKTEVCSKYNLSSTTFTRLVNYYGISKANDKKIIYPPKEKFYNFYIVENHSVEETLREFPEFHQNRSNITNCCNYYGICKNNQQRLLIRMKGRKKWHPLITREDIEKQYLENNFSQKDVADNLNISISELNKYLSYYNITKPLDKIINQRKKTNLQKFGCEVPIQNKEILDKVKKTNLQKYGYEYASQSPIIQEKIAESNLKKFGAVSYLISKEGKKHIAEINKEKFGHEVYNLSNREHLLLTTQQLLADINSFKKYLLNFEQKINRKPYIYEIAEDLKYAYTSTVQYINRNGLNDYVSHQYCTSQGEKEICTWLEQNQIKYHCNVRDVLPSGLELDIYCPDYKIAIEYNGTYWHSSECKNMTYHYKKSKEAQNLGIRLIHIYEYEWKDELMREKLKSILKMAFGKVSNKIFARKCAIKQITNKEAKELNDHYHLQNHRCAKVTYGLYYNDKLIQIMSFSSSKYNRNLKSDKDWEIIRSCSVPDVMIIGGVSKLINHFIKDYNPENIFTYCDFNKFDGRSYEKAGMKYIGDTQPDLKWVINGKVYNRNPSNHKKMKEISDYCIYGAGSKKYLWTRN